MTQNRPTHTHRSNDAPRQVSRRIKVTLPAAVAQQLERLAMRAGEPPAKVAAQMIRQAVTDNERDKSDRHRQAREHAPREHAVPAEQDERAPWLEPYGGSREWRGLTWGPSSACTPATPTPCPTLRTAGGVTQATWRPERTRGLAPMDRRRRSRPARRACLPSSTRRLQPCPATRTRQHPQRLATRSPAHRVVLAHSPARTRRKRDLIGTLRSPQTRKPHVMGLSTSGRYWARTSDLRLVEAALSQLS
jgi:hypothetical protein